MIVYPVMLRLLVEIMGEYNIKQDQNCLFQLKQIIEVLTTIILIAGGFKVILPGKFLTAVNYDGIKLCKFGKAILFF